MIKEYTITTDGLSNGNVIAAPFTIQVSAMNYKRELILCVCSINGGETVCDNDEIASVLSYDLPAMTSSKNSDLAATIEVLLEEVYPSNWS